MKMYGGVEILVYAFLTLTPDGGEWLASRPGPFTSGERTPRYLLDRSLGGPLSWSGHGD